jgi:ABC-2 type transport system ATP-binding protein
VDAAYATQRDVSRTKRDIKTFEVRLRVDNKDRALAVGHDRVRLAARRVGTAMPAIDVRDIVKKFGDFTAVNGVSFTVEEARSSASSAPTGRASPRSSACSTTLLPPPRARPWSAASTSHRRGRRAPVHRRDPQALTSDLELSVEENLIIFAKLYGVPRAKRVKLIDELLAAVELTQWRSRP